MLIRYARMLEYVVTMMTNARNTLKKDKQKGYWYHKQIHFLSSKDNSLNLFQNITYYIGLKKYQNPFLWRLSLQLNLGRL